MPKLPGKYYHLPPEYSIIRGQRFRVVNSLRRIFNTMMGIATRGRRIAKIVKDEKCEAIISCSGDLLDLPAAYFASRLTGVPFYPYVFDYYAYQFVDVERRHHAAFLEPFLIRGAKNVIVPNETLAEELHQRYGSETTVLHNPTYLSQYSSVIADDTDRIAGQVRIVYTGAIYDAHFDAFRNLLRAIENLDRDDVRLHVYTALPREWLEANGIRGPIVIHDHVATEKIPSIQKEADILFLPLAFECPYPEIIRTSAPVKLGEYLAAGRPVLVHSPPDCFLSWYFRRHECGIVVDQNDAAAVGRAIEQILADPNLRRRVSENAWRQAVSDFSIEGGRAEFCNLLKLDPANDGNREFTPPSRPSDEW
jgi:glycosyltransferase involved in cell wall biosynthesis